MNKGRRRQLTFSLGYMLLIGALLVGAQLFTGVVHTPKVVPYSELLSLVAQGKVESVAVGSDDIVATLKGEAGKRKDLVAAGRLPGIPEGDLVSTLQAKGVPFSGHTEKAGWLWGTLGWLLPTAFFFVLWSWGLRRLGRAGGPLSVGKSSAKIYDLNLSAAVTFADVAGIDDAKSELLEIVNFLKNPARYRAIGARAPKGVLLMGPPGTGKTLLARAVAGEAGAPFFSISGSEFVQMFVGVGAARVRDLFEQAKVRAPCIVFVDELDAVGRSRAGVAGGFAAHEEREQTLNQLLVEMDGFDSSVGVVILAATNRPEVLDRALLRAGRFDRQVRVDRPDLQGREAILKVHAQKVRVGGDVDLKVVARRTPGMVGADLANLVNEAALAAARRGAEEMLADVTSRPSGDRRGAPEIEPKGGRGRPTEDEGRGLEVTSIDFEEAIDRIQLGLKKQGLVMNGEERKRVAYHEAGHALVALSLTHADPVHRVTIIPRSTGPIGAALGSTLQLPTEEHYLVTREELRDRLAVMLGGRSAEELIFGDVSTGAADDLERATQTASLMVTRFGMSERLGPLAYPQADEPGIGFFRDVSARGFSEATARLVDAEVHAIIEQAHERAREILSLRRVVLERLGERLLVEETLDAQALHAIVGPGEPERQAG